MGFTLGNLFGSLIGLLDNSGVRQIADSPGAKALAANRVFEQARHTLPGIIADEIAHGDPDRSEQAVIDDMDGRLWHNARPDITDYYVAELRGDPAYDGPLRDLIRQALTAAAETVAPETPEFTFNHHGPINAAADLNAPAMAVTDGATQAEGVTTLKLTEAVIVPPEGIVPPHEDASGMALPPHDPPSEPDPPQTFPQ